MKMTNVLKAGNKLEASTKLMIDIVLERGDQELPDSFIKLNDLQRLEVLRALLQGTDINLVCNEQFDSYQMYQLRRALKSNLDVLNIYDPNLSSSQMSVIIKGMVKGVDVTYYNKPEFNQDQMNEIMIGLIQGVDISEYCSAEIDDLTMRKTRNVLLNDKIKMTQVDSITKEYQVKLKNILDNK